MGEHIDDTVIFSSFKKLMILEDNPVDAQLYQELFPNADVYIDAREGLADFSPRSHSALITDIRMPYLSGFDVAKELRSQYGSRIPIIASSAIAPYDNGGSDNLSLFDMYYEKGDGFASLPDKVNSCIKNHYSKLFSGVEPSYQLSE